MTNSTLIAIMLLAGGYSLAQAPPTIQQSLAANGIGLSQDDLRKALHHQRAVIRGLAAMQLAEDRDTSSIGRIERGLAEEKDPTTRFDFARALSLLGDGEGDNEMNKLCADTSLPPDLRIQAAHDLLHTRSNACFLAMSKLLSESLTLGDQLFLLDFLFRSSNFPVTAEASAALQTGLEKLVSDDKNPAPLRLRAAACIAQYHLLEAAPVIRKAAAQEKDPATKRGLENAERALTSP